MCVAHSTLLQGPRQAHHVCKYIHMYQRHHVFALCWMDSSPRGQHSQSADPPTRLGTFLFSRELQELLVHHPHVSCSSFQNSKCMGMVEAFTSIYLQLTGPPRFASPSYCALTLVTPTPASSKPRVLQTWVSNYKENLL